MKRLSVDELTRLAFVWAEQDRAALADAWPDGEERDKAMVQYKQLKAYRTKRWGATNMERLMTGAKTMNVLERKKP